jgi:hypothetical protein
LHLDLNVAKSVLFLVVFLGYVLCPAELLFRHALGEVASSLFRELTSQKSAAEKSGREY